MSYYHKYEVRRIDNWETAVNGPLSKVRSSIWDLDEQTMPFRLPRESIPLHGNIGYKDTKDGDWFHMCKEQ